MSTRPLPTVALDVVRGVFLEAAARGAEFRSLCERFGVSPELLATVDARIPVDQLRRIWDELPQLVAGSDFGLGVARRAQAASALGILGHVVRSAATVGDGLRLALRYQRLVTDAVRGVWVEANDTVRVSFEARDAAFRPPRHAMEFGVASLLLIVREAAGRELAPLHIAFRHARPADDGEARRIFGCTLDYEADIDTVMFARTDLDVPMRSADPYLSTLLQAHAAQMEQRLPAASSFAGRVRHALAEALVHGDTSIAAIAKRLRLSTRTLQRRLQDEGTSHKQVLDELRRDLALRYLEDGKLSQQEIAFVLGFSEQSAFQHAFARWTGRSPGAYRAQRARRDSTEYL